MLSLKRPLKIASVFLILLFIISSCEHQEKKQFTEQELSEYVLAYTSGVISSGSGIKVRLANIPENWYVGEMISQGYFRFDPPVHGTAYLREFNVIEFVPENNFKSGKEYKLDFHLGKIFTNTPGYLKTIPFSFTIISQDYEIDAIGLSLSGDDNLYVYKGIIRTADIITDFELEKILNARINNKKMDIQWEHDASGRSHTFKIAGIPRMDNEQELLIKWDGKEIDVDKTGSETVKIPSKEVFNISSVQVVQEPEQYVVIRFSDPIDNEMNLDGLITMTSADKLKLTISGNTIKVYPSQTLNGAQKLEIFSGIKNSVGRRLPKNYEYILSFEDLKPAVKLIGNGVILPSSEGLVFNFEAVNLKAVDLTIFRIYENNIPQFLQVNRMGESNEMTRVGKPILKKQVKLATASNTNFSNWNVYSLELSEVINQEPGALYRVMISFKKEYSTYDCYESGENEKDELLLETTYDLDKEFSGWDAPYYYKSYYPQGYRWSQRDNPCHVSYYYRERFKSTNLLVSDLGIIAKGATDHSMFFAVTDLKSTNPIGGVNIEVYDYQNQLLETIRTGHDGFAELTFSKKPYLLVASHNRQKGYLRLDDGTSLSMSKFDVNGMRVQKGLKGFIYGDRGVWRPGDTLFLNFILYDKDNVLPEGHPVKMELYNPQGQLVKSKVGIDNAFGIYNFTMITYSSAPTGNWRAKVKVGNIEFSRRIRIETIKPNRLKIKLDLGDDKILVASSDFVKGSIQSNWLHGAPAKNLRTSIEMTLNRSYTAFENYPDFTFTDPTKYFESTTSIIFDDTLNDSGFARFNSQLGNPSRAPGMLKAIFYTRIFEKGGDFSFDYYSLPYSPYNKYIGIKPPEGDDRNQLLTDSIHKIEIITVDYHGNPVQTKGLVVRVLKVNWNWWWNATDNDLASYYGDEYLNPVEETKVSTDQNGKASFKFSIPYPSWGRYLIHVSDPVGGHACGNSVFVDWPGYAGRDRGGHPEAASMLNFTSDKEKYQVGETATITFPSSDNSRALVSLENGTGILDTYWVETTEPETKFTLKITEDMCPNIYVNLSLIQPHSQTANDLPIRLYGIKSLLVEDPNTKLIPVIEMPDEIRPEEIVSIKVYEEYGKAMGFTLAVVDEGLLDLTRFKTPDPWGTFYAKEALGIKTWDIYDYVIGAYGAKLEKLFAIGGGMEEEEKGKTKVNRFKPVVKFFGPFDLPQGEEKEITFIMPNYVGSVRTMLIAAGDGAYGSAEVTSAVKKPLMVLASLPRVLGPGEEVTLPVNVFAMDKDVKNVNISVETNKNLTIQGPSSKKMEFTGIGTELVDFKLEVEDILGIGKVKIIAKSGNETASQEIEIEIRNPNPPVSKSVFKILEAGEESEFFVDLPGIVGTNEASLEISSLPPVDFSRRLKYLLRYPHGCAEQTISAAFPQLFLENVMELSNSEKEASEKNVKLAINKIHRIQMSNGGIRYWPGYTHANDWVTSYGGHFMLEAEKKGFTLPAGFRESWIKYQKTAANNWKRKVQDFRGYYYQPYLSQAYRLYTLALAGQAQLGAMNRLKEETGLTLAAKWRLAGAYALAGQSEAALEMIASLGYVVKEYKHMSASFGSSLRDRAMILETMSLLDLNEEAIPLMLQISGQMGDQHWYSTQTTAFCLVSIASFTGNQKQQGEPLKFELSIGDEDGKEIISVKPYYQLSLDVNEKQQEKLFVNNTSSSSLYLVINSSGTPLVDEQPAIAQNLSLDLTFFDLSGKEIDITKIEQGTDFIAEVTIVNPGIMGRLNDMALTQIFPSGWEIINTRLGDYDRSNAGDSPDYQDFRDDRVYTYFDSSPGHKLKFRVLLNASYLGKFYLPAVSCEAMYDNHIQAREPGKWVKVVRAGDVRY